MAVGLLLSVRLSEVVIEVGARLAFLLVDLLEQEQESVLQLSVLEATLVHHHSFSKAPHPSQWQLQEGKCNKRRAP
jgi:hypothetical protein